MLGHEHGVVADDLGVRDPAVGDIAVRGLAVRDPVARDPVARDPVATGRADERTGTSPTLTAGL
ncbi:hypothetical protein ACFY64_32960 [Streptomyces collinus]|uniref:hypothetical protein n=1 Tax=Streptomyces collinus TaxID=42684 RepID=UPI0036AA0124